MQELKKSFKLNGLQYTLLKRNDVVAMCGVGGEYTDKIIQYEVCKIYIRKPDRYCTEYRESLPTNEKFGKDKSMCFKDQKLAYEYFDVLTGILNRGKGVPKVVIGVEEKVAEVSEVKTNRAKVIHQVL